VTGVIDRDDLRAALRFVIGSEPRGISFSNLVADLKDVEPTVTKLAVAEELDRLLATGEIRQVGTAARGDRRFHVASTAQASSSS
jgi:hypothetical protein